MATRRRAIETHLLDWRRLMRTTNRSRTIQSLDQMDRLRRDSIGVVGLRVCSVG